MAPTTTAPITDLTTTTSSPRSAAYRLEAGATRRPSPHKWRYAGRSSDHTGLADPARRLPAFHEVDIDLRHLVDAQHAIVVEIRLLNAALVQRDFAIQCGRQTENHAALDLRDDRVRINDEAAIHSERHLAYVDLAVGVHLCLNDGGDRRIEGRLHADAPADAQRQRLAPVGLFRYEVQHALEARRLSEHIASKRDRILAHLVRQLIHEAFDGEHVVVRADAAPKSGQHRRWLDADLF